MENNIERRVMWGIVLISVADAAVELPGMPIRALLAVVLISAALWGDSRVLTRTILYGAVGLVLTLVRSDLPFLPVRIVPVPEDVLGPAGVSVGLLWYAALSLVLLRALRTKASTRTEAKDIDGLTQLYNKRFFDERLRELLSTTGRRQGDRQVGLLFCDLDNFKKLNDTYGHDAGDDFLRDMALFLRRSRAFRTSDFACRVGGDEFAIILTDLHAADLPLLTERLSSTVDDFVVSNPSAAAAGVGISIGSALAAPGSTAADLLAAADADMYANKRARKARLGQEAR